jgi:hypothetical protein
MTPPTAGMLIVWTNAAAGQEDEFNAWYSREHLGDRVSVPGFRNGARYLALRGDPKYLAVYETETPEVLSTPTYRERLNQPTPWTRRIMPHFRDTIRCTCSVIAQAGLGTGGYLRTYRLDPAPGQKDPLRDALTGTLARAALEPPAVARVRVAELTAPAATASTAETAMRGADRTVSFTVLIDGESEAALAVAGQIVEAYLGTLRGATSGSPAVGDYRLMLCLSRLDAGRERSHALSSPG